MSLSQKCQYAVRAILELSLRHGTGVVPTAEIARRQAIPQRFLEVILNELKPTGLVDSRRGTQGGYLLAQNPKQITVGQVIRLIDGALDPVNCAGSGQAGCCPLKENCSLMELWTEAKNAVENVYDSTSFQDLVDKERAAQTPASMDYCI